MAIAAGWGRPLERFNPEDFPMLPPFFCCADGESALQQRRRHQERKLQALTFWRDGLERQLAAINAAISTLQRQMEQPGDA